MLVQSDKNKFSCPCALYMLYAINASTRVIICGKQRPWKTLDDDLTICERIRAQFLCREIVVNLCWVSVSYGGSKAGPKYAQTQIQWLSHRYYQYKDFFFRFGTTKVFYVFIDTMVLPVRRRWANLKPTQEKYLAFVGYWPTSLTPNPTLSCRSPETINIHELLNPSEGTCAPWGVTGHQGHGWPDYGK